MNISRIVKNKKEFDVLVEMLEQEAKINKLEPKFNSLEPDDYPCLIKVNEIYNIDVDIDLGEVETEEELEEKLKNVKEIHEMIYHFTFFTQKEIKELLEV